MDMLKIAMLGVTGVFLALLLKSHKPEYGVFLSLSVGIIIFLYAMDKMAVMISYIRQLQSSLPIEGEYVGTILRMIGITYLAEFASNICKDAGYGAIASLISVAAFNFFFTVPRFTFQAADPSYPVTFFIMLIASFLASSLADRVKVQARLASEKGYYTELLLESSQKLLKGRDEWECLRLAAEQLHRLFGRPVLYAYNGPGSELQLRVEPSDQTRVLQALTPQELGVAQWVRQNNKNAGATTHTLPESKWLFMSVRGTREVMGIVGIPVEGYAVPDAFEKNLMVAILNECGLIQERIRLQKQRQKED